MEGYGIQVERMMKRLYRTLSEKDRRRYAAVEHRWDTARSRAGLRARHVFLAYRNLSNPNLDGSASGSSSGQSSGVKIDEIGVKIIDGS